MQSAGFFSHATILKSPFNLQFEGSHFESRSPTPEELTRKRGDSPPDDGSSQASWQLCWRRGTRATGSCRRASQNVASSWRPDSAICEPRPATFVGHQAATETSTSWITLASCKRQDWPREATTSGRSLGRSATIYPHRPNEGDGGGSNASDDLGSDLVELRDVPSRRCFCSQCSGCIGLLTSSSMLSLVSCDQFNQAEQADKIENIVFQCLKRRSDSVQWWMMVPWFE